MNSRSVGLAAAIVCSMISATAAQRTPAGSGPRSVFVRVLDQANAPVLDLQPRDFEIREEGAPREVTRATLVSKIPMRILLLLDTSNHAAPALPQLRTAVAGFVDALTPPHEAAIITTGIRPTVLVSPTADHLKLKNAARRLVTDGAGTATIDALLDTDKLFISRVPDRWPVYVIVTSDGNESSKSVDDKGLNVWVRTLGARGIAAHTIALKFKGVGLGDEVAQTATENAGGRYEYINSANSLADKMKTLAGQILSDFERAGTKYQIDFLTSSQDARFVEVRLARDGFRLEISAGRIR